MATYDDLRSLVMSEQELHISEAQASADRDALERRVAELERDLAQLRGREAGWREERTRLLAALEAAEREVASLPDLRRELEAGRDAAYWLAVTHSSLWWRVGERLRRVARMGRRGAGT
jgi:chromosome segregation ATPase